MDKKNASHVFFPLFRSQRLQFDVSSPNGILLFRETSKMITMYGEYLKCLCSVGTQLALLRRA